jgi:hypothetical protein
MAYSFADKSEQVNDRLVVPVRRIDPALKLSQIPAE